MFKIIDNIPNKKTNKFQSNETSDNVRNINSIIEGFEIIDKEDLEYSSYTSQPSLQKTENKKISKHVDFLPSSINDKIDALIKNEITADKPNQYVILTKSNEDTDKLLINKEDETDDEDEVEEDEYLEKNEINYSNDVTNKNKKMDVLTNIYIGSITVIGLLMLYRFIQKSR
jgi:hypothetical protein